MRQKRWPTLTRVCRGALPATFQWWARTLKWRRLVAQVGAEPRPWGAGAGVAGRHRGGALGRRRPTRPVEQADERASLKADPRRAHTVGKGLDANGEQRLARSEGTEQVPDAGTVPEFAEAGREAREGGFKVFADLTTK